MRAQRYSILLALVCSGTLEFSARASRSKEIWARVSPSVVVISAGRPGGGASIGSGSLITRTGLVLTNHHVIAEPGGTASLRVFLKPPHLTGATVKDLRPALSAQVLHGRADLDLAILELSSTQGLPEPLVFARNPAGPGELALAIGHPVDGGLWSITKGIVSSRVADFEKVPGKHVYQMQTPLNPGNSGGPVVNGDGHMLGVASAAIKVGRDGLPTDSLHFAITADTVRTFLAEALSRLGEANQHAQELKVLIAGGTKPGGGELGNASIQARSGPSGLGDLRPSPEDLGNTGATAPAGAISPAYEARRRSQDQSRTRGWKPADPNERQRVLALSGSSSDSGASGSSVAGGATTVDFHTPPSTPSPPSAISGGATDVKYLTPPSTPSAPSVISGGATDVKYTTPPSTPSAPSVISGGATDVKYLTPPSTPSTPSVISGGATDVKYTTPPSTPSAPSVISGGATDVKYTTPPSTPSPPSVISGGATDVKYTTPPSTPSTPSGDGSASKMSGRLEQDATSTPASAIGAESALQLAWRGNFKAALPRAKAEGLGGRVLVGYAALVRGGKALAAADYPDARQWLWRAKNTAATKAVAWYWTCVSYQREGKADLFQACARDLTGAGLPVPAEAGAGPLPAASE